MDRLVERLDRLRGPVAPRNHNARTIAALTSNPGCARRGVLDAAGVNKGEIARHLGFPAGYGQSRFAIARGNAFEAQVKADGCADLVFCTEVFEHLPPAETARALSEIGRILKPGGRLLVGVPVEIGPPALAKGLFRALRRPGEFDARPAPVASALLCRPPRARPLDEISPGRAYYPHHLGFDHRALAGALAARFRLEGSAGSPFPALPWWLNSELYVRAVRA